MLPEQAEAFNMLGYFVAVQGLLINDVPSPNFKVVYMEAQAVNSASKIQDGLIAELGGNPERNLEARARQLKKLVNSSLLSNGKVVVVMNNAHALSPSTLRAMKQLVELSDEWHPRVGFVLVGNQAALRKKIDKYEEVASRTKWL